MVVKLDFDTLYSKQMLKFLKVVTLAKQLHYRYRVPKVGTAKRLLSESD
jgi:hypothetical protein